MTDLRVEAIVTSLWDQMDARARELVKTISAAEGATLTEIDWLKVGTGIQAGATAMLLELRDRGLISLQA